MWNIVEKINQRGVKNPGEKMKGMVTIDHDAYEEDKDQCTKEDNDQCTNSDGYVTSMLQQDSFGE